MSTEELLGLMIGFGFLAAVAGCLADAWFHPDKYRWQELPRPETKVGTEAYALAPRRQISRDCHPRNMLG